MRRGLPAVVGIALAIVATGACAHAPIAGMGHFYAGMLHPLTAFEHVLALVGIGLLTGQIGIKRMEWIYLVFPLCFALGASLAWPVASLPYVMAINLLSAVVLGLLVAIAWPLPTWAVYALAIAFGLSHGYANGARPGSGINPLLFTAGLTLSALLVVAYAALLVEWLGKRNVEWPRIAVRVAGSWIAAIGILVLAGNWKTLA